MAKDATATVPAKGPAQEESGSNVTPMRPLRQLVRRALRPVEVIDLPDLAPMVVARPLRPERAAGLPALADLSGRKKVIILVGPGGAGKTTAANLLASDFISLGILQDGLSAATDPGVVGFAPFLPPGSVYQPANRTAASAEDLTRDVLGEMEADDAPAFIMLDCGGGSTALASLAEKDRGLFSRLEAKGVAVVMLWCWTPRLIDLALFKSFQGLGVKPTATAFVMNGALARDGWEAYEPLRQQPIYQAALKAGAAEVFMPALRQEVALEVERKGILFEFAAKGVLPPWKPAGMQPVEGDASMEVGLWLPEARQEWAPIQSWVRP